VGNAVNERAVWSQHGDSAELSCGKLSGRIVATRPNAGLHGVALEGAELAIDLLRTYRADVAEQMTWPLAIAESYVRGKDFVATYQAADDWPFSPQLYWRGNSLGSVRGVVASVSLLVSVQTHLLDTIPRIGVTSRLRCEETLRVSPARSEAAHAELVDPAQEIRAEDEDCCFVRRLADLPLSYVEIMPAGDFHAIRAHADSAGTAIEWRLFADFLEKGVIRRARVHAAFVPRENDIEIAAACSAALHRLELPLTT
jgi:hypothetical protein